MKKLIISLITVATLVMMTLPAASVSANTLQYELEGYTLAPHPKWTTGNLKGYAEGDCIPFRYKVENTGDDSLSLNLTLRYDHKHGDGVIGIVDFEYSDIPAGNITDPVVDGSGYYYWEVTIPPHTTYNLTWCARLSNEAGLWPGSTLQVRADGTKTVSINVNDIGMPDLYAEKSADVTCDAISYTISYGNNGEADQTSTVLFDDYDETKVEVTDDGGGTDDGDMITWNIGDLATGATGSKSYTVSINEGVANDDAIVNTGSITGDLADNNDSDNAYSLTTDAKVSPTALASSNSPVYGGDTIELYGGPGGMDSYYWTGPNSFSSTSQNPTIPSATMAMAGTYTLTVTNSNGCSDSDDAVVTVTPRALEITADSNSKVYDGTPLTDDGYSITSGSLASGDTLDSVTVTGSQTEVGSSDNVPSAAVILHGTVDVTSSYDITYVNGTLTVTQSPPPPPTPAGGGGACPTTKYLTVDWEGNNTTEPLYSNDKLAVDLFGPSPNLASNLFLERATHAPIVGATTYYLIVVRELEEYPALPENTEAIVVYNVTPTDAVFNKDIFLTLGLTDAQLPATGNVTMEYYDDINHVWVPLDYEAGGPSGVAELTLSAPINHFSIYGVLAELAPTPVQPAHFVPSGLSITPSVDKTVFVTKTGETVTITANIANDGGQEGTYDVVLKLNGQTVDTKTVTVGAGQTKQVTFTESGLAYGQYEAEVAGLTGEFTASRAIAWWLIILIIAVVGLIIWGIVWGRRRRRKAQQEA